MSRISGAVPLQRYGPTPIAGGTPQSIQGAYNRNFQTADDINRGLAANIEQGYQTLAADQRSAQDLLGAGYADMGARARQRSDELRDRTLGTGVDPNTGIPTGHLGIMQQGFDWLQGSNRARAAGYKQLYDDAMEDVRSLGATERADLEERYRRAAADSDTSLARRGLGNSTVRDSARRGIDFDRARASTALTDTLTRERLGVRGQFGTAEQQFLERAGERNREQQNMIARARADADTGISQFGTQGELGAYGQSLAAQERGIGRNTDLGLSQLGWMNSIQAPYPNAGQYAALAQAAGQGQVDPYGGGGGSAAGGHTVTRGGPWNPPGLGLTPGRAGFDEGVAMANMPAFIPGPNGQLINSRSGLAQTGGFTDSYVQRQLEPFYGQAGGGPTQGGTAGPGPAPAQTGGGGPGPYSPQGFGGGFGGYAPPVAPGEAPDWAYSGGPAGGFSVPQAAGAVLGGAIFGIPDEAPPDWMLESDFEG